MHCDYIYTDFYRSATHKEVKSSEQNKWIAIVNERTVNMLVNKNYELLIKRRERKGKIENSEMDEQELHKY